MKQSEKTIAVTNNTQFDNSAETQLPCPARFGHVVAINESADSVRVDFEGNPFNQPLSARLGRAFRRSEIQLAIDNQLNCRIEFINGDLSLPVVSDIFFSLLSDGGEVVLRADKLVLDAQSQLIVKSGDTQTRYSGRDKRITTEAKYITSQAEKSQKIQGGTISLN